MKIVIIVAISRNNVIGDQQDIPWHYPADMKHFRRVTRGHPFVAGRKTFESFQVRPLPGRLNIILTRNSEYPAPDGVEVVTSFAAAKEICQHQNAEKMFVLGGAEIYRLALPETDEMVITHVPLEVEGDTRFPQWNPDEWDIVDNREKEDLRFVTYRRNAHNE